jgi:hypothetical protein
MTLEAMAVARYRPVHTGFWWRVIIGDGQKTVGRCYTRIEASRLAAALTEAFLDGAFVAREIAQANAALGSER